MIRFDDRVAIVTGAGAGLGRAHALGLAARGARVVVNDPKGAGDVAEEIRAAGGESITHAGDVASEFDVTDMVSRTMARWGRIDILVNNAGILRDRSFAKMNLEDLRRVMAVHLLGSAICAHAVWPIMREQRFGRVVFTTSSSGLYGNFGQANYGGAKAGMIGLMNVLHIEGEKYNIRVNALSPTALTAMTDGLFDEAVADVLSPESITPGLLWLVSDEAPSRFILAAGGGSFARVLVAETPGICLTGGELTPEAIAAQADRIADAEGAQELQGAFLQTEKFARQALAALGRKS